MFDVWLLPKKNFVKWCRNMSWIYGITLPFPGIGEDSNFSMTKSLVCSSLSLLLCRNLQSPTFARFFSQIIGGTISNPIDAVQKTERGSDNDIAGNHDQVATLTTFRQSQSNSSETLVCVGSNNLTCSGKYFS